MQQKNAVTLALIVVNVLVFAVVAFLQQNILFNRPEDVIMMLHAGANFNPLTTGGEPWRMITSMFLHFGILHLFVNMYGLWQLGQLLEPGIGSFRYGILYFICGLAASFASIFFNVYVISAGASGAIFGLYGFMLTVEIISTYNDRENLKRVLLNFGIFVAVNALISQGVSVDMAGHIGGFVAGVIIALCHFKLQVLRTPQAMIIVFVSLWALLFFVPSGQREYYEAYQRVIRLEDETNRLLKSEMNESVLYDSIKQEQQQWVKIADQLRELSNVPSAVEDDRESLTQYVTLRARQAAYRVHMLEQTYIYRDSLEVLNDEFARIPKLKKSLNFTIRKEDETDSTQTDSTSTPEYEMVRVFFDKDWKETDDVQAPYYRIGMRDSMGRWQGDVQDYYANGAVQMKGEYKDGLQNGVFIYYSDHGTYSSAGRYQNEDPVGKWQTFHWNGKLESNVLYNDRVQTISVWDSLGNVLVANGNGKYTAWYDNGQVKEEGEYRNGLRTGMWLGYRRNGDPYYKEEYLNNRLVRGMSLGDHGREFVYDHSSFFPTPLMGVAKYREYLDQHVQLPDNPMARGVVKVIFTVGADESRWNYLVLDSSCPPCNAEAIRVVREGPGWRPALLHGQEKIQSQAYTEVHFQ